ncbi:MAG TPA: choice-of-anchor V domain-containing protein [Pyrinomonadaceae bacterium]
MKKIKILCLLLFIGLAIAKLATKNNRFVHTSAANASGPPAGVSGAPDEASCNACHGGSAEVGQFTVTAPENYTPGQTYQIVVRHQTNDNTRRRWGFQLTALAGATMAGSFNTGGSINTQIISGFGSRTYIEHTSAGTFTGQGGGAVWVFNWTAPATNVGAVTFYSAGNQANNDGTPDGDQIYLTSATAQPPATATRPPIYDFDGDDKSDISVFRPSDGVWYLLRSQTGFTAAQFGISTDKPAPADYDGDDKTDIAVFRDNTWYLLRSQLGFTAVQFGATGDIPQPADFDGDGKAELGIFRPSTGTWFMLNLANGGFNGVQFGANGDKPVVADYDGDRKADQAVFRPSDGAWYMLRSQTGFTAVQFGISTDKPVVGDYDGDGKADQAVYRPADGTWYLLRSQAGFTATQFGISTDLPAPGDYDGDAKTDLTVFRDGVWYLLKSTQGFTGVQFGATGDKPVPNSFVP